MAVIGILGGSFDPPHEGHVHVMAQAHEHIGLEEVWMLITPQSPHKEGQTPAPLSHRMAMARLLAQGRAWIKPMDIEKDFASRRTADTLTTLSKMYPQHHFIWIMGADCLAHFHTWDREHYAVAGKIVPDWQYILHHFPVAVMARPQEEGCALTSPAVHYAVDLKVKDPQDLRTRPFGWCLVPNALLDVSSSRIARELAAGKRDIEGLPAPIRDYIFQNGLYGPSSLT